MYSGPMYSEGLRKLIFDMKLGAEVSRRPQ